MHPPLFRSVGYCDGNRETRGFQNSLKPVFFARKVAVIEKMIGKTDIVVTFGGNLSMSDLLESGQIRSHLKEDRKFTPDPKFSQSAHMGSMQDYETTWKTSVSDPTQFWGETARQFLHWQKDFTKVFQGKMSQAEWFADGKLNVSENCIDRHIRDGRGDKTAIIWEGEQGDQRRLSYQDLGKLVNQCANTLTELGIQAGDRVAIYMPLVPEAIATMQACARIGAAHNVIFAGFSAEALAERIRDCDAKMIVTADHSRRRGQLVALKEQADIAADQCPSVEKVLVYRNSGEKVDWQQKRDVWWHETVEKASQEHTPQAFDAEHPLFILYTSGSTGKPKGILHTSAGYLLGATYSSRMVFDLQEPDIFWCTADIGWITGHSYVAYGPLSNGATVFIYEGAPDFPNQSRFWDMIERHRVSIFYTAPTAIRSFAKWGDAPLQGKDLSSLRLLGTVGEPINPEAWMWFHEKVGGGRCPIVDTWWQTETGSIMIAPLPGATATKPGSATKPFLGIKPEIMTAKGEKTAAGEGGFLVISQPWPSMLRGIWGDQERFQKTYWEHIPGVYFTGDGARQDEDGYFWILGRIDDVINVAGHRLSTMEIESALVEHKAVAEAAVVGRPDEISGEAVVCFVSLEKGQSASEQLKSELAEQITRHIGKFARVHDIRFTDHLPKTRSGKIMRRLLRDVASGQNKGQDTSTLEDHTVLEKLRESDQQVAN